MTDIERVFEELKQGDSFRKIKADNSPLSIFCGFRSSNLPSLAFMTKNPPLLIESTQYIKVSQWQEKTCVYWSSFDLQLANARTIFYALCLDLISASKEKDTDEAAMTSIKNRYMVWRKMFRKASSPMTQEEYQGLFGELYFLNTFLIEKIGVEKAIKSWSGANKTSKDFSLNADWFEIKTVSTNVNEVKISSLTQLESEIDGQLVVVSVEKMSSEYVDGHSTVEELLASILQKIDDVELKDEFLGKIAAYGYQVDADLQSFPHFKVHKATHYVVNDAFPKITSENIPFDEITKVSYSISLNSIKAFVKE